MCDSVQNLVVKTLAKGNTAQLSLLVKECHDRDVAREIYTELLRIANELSRKYNFAITRDKVK